MFNENDDNNADKGVETDPFVAGGPTNEAAQVKSGKPVFQEKIINDPLKTGGPTNQQATAKSDSPSDDQYPNHFPVV